MKTTMLRVVAGLAIGLSLVLVVPLVASAGTTSVHTTRTYARSVHSIDRHFLMSVASAKRAEVSALAHATTQGQRNTARQRYRLAVDLATTARDEALVALGPAPK
ncbi:MAG TPA: hypothetical protein VND83_09730 [Acidimicrobiales bacterium]|nr:hypothetical protein [Acidimicrobiales bacterium]